ncbi:hypothetical protein P8452_51940 [Trifolium repens]|nr:hypothetical protein P8452_51940 [Trifolium repens]
MLPLCPFVASLRPPLPVKKLLISASRASLKSRITLSIKQLEEDPLLETLDKVMPQDGSAAPSSDSGRIEPLPGLETILEELLQEDGVVSQDLQLWLSNAPPMEQRFTRLARAGRQETEQERKHCRGSKSHNAEARPLVEQCVLPLDFFLFFLRWQIKLQKRLPRIIN